MYILQDMCPFLYRRIDRIRGKRNGEAGVEIERHYLVLKMTVAHSESGFPFISRFDPHQIVCSPKIDLRENMCSSESIQ
jgi:hypothetical protein